MGTVIKMVGYPLFVLLLLVAEIESSSQTDSRLPWAGARLRLALRQAKRSSDNEQPMLETIQNGSQWKSKEDTRLCENSDTCYQTSHFRSKVDLLEEMIKNLQHAIEAKQQGELMRIVKRPRIDGRIRILKRLGIGKKMDGRIRILKH